MQWIDFQHIRKLRPCVTLPLTSPVQPVEQQSPNPVQETCTHRSVVCDCVVVVVTIQHFVNPLDHFAHRHMPFSFDMRIHFFQFLAKLLPAGFPLHSEPPFTAFRAVVCESQKSKVAGLPPRFFAFPSAYLPNSISLLFSSCRFSPKCSNLLRKAM